MKNVEIIYASTSGNTELVMEFLKSKLEVEKSIAFNLYRAELTDIEVIQKNKFFIFGTSTWEHGVLNPFFNNLYSGILKNNMAGKFAGFVGCGSVDYESVLFCRGIDIIKEGFISQGGTQIGMTLKVNGDPHSQLEGYITKWVENFKPLLLAEVMKAES
ncbi:flavodoxin domain-containing protein [Candidatus Dojkabacteria bacterium]|nr:flavodoxin domain-containing protein [Candidatus Dojkabacteria bacterium]